MKTLHEGGCLCGAIRFQVTRAPAQVIVCHCTFCQRATGSAFLMAAVFDSAALTVRGATPSRYAHRSDGSGLHVTLHFCGTCGAMLYQVFERLPGVVGVWVGTFDDPTWVGGGGTIVRHIFTRSAQPGVVLPAGVEIFEGHFLGADGAVNTPVIHPHPVSLPGRV